MGETNYNTVGDSDNVENLTEDAYNMYGKHAEQAWGEMSDVANMLKNFKQFQQREYDPTEGFGFFTNTLANQLQGLTIGATNPLGQAIQNQQQYDMYNARRELEGMFGNQLGFGGAAKQQAARVFGEIGAGTTRDILGAQTGMFQQLGSIGLQQAPSQFQAATDMYNRYGLAARDQRLQALQGAADTWQGAYGAASAGQTASFNAWEPTYVEDPWSNLGYDVTSSLLGGFAGGLGQGLTGLLF